MRYRITDEYTLVTRDRSDKLYLEWRENGRPKRRSTGTNCPEQARAVARRIILESAEIQNAPADGVPLYAVLARYFSQKTLASTDVTKRSIAVWNEYFKTAMVADLTVQKQEAFIRWLQDKGYSDGYARRVVGVGKAALNWAWKRGEIAAVPFVELPTASDEAYPYYASREQLIEFLSRVPDGHLWTYCMIRLNTGCRGDAALDLRPAQVDYTMMKVALNPPGRRQTKKYRPTVPLTRFLASYLRTVDTDPYVAWNGMPIKSIKKTWASMARDMPDWFHAKVVRHTVATTLRQAGVAAWDVKGIMGHHRGTTEIYAKLDPNFLVAARDALDAWMTDLAADVPRMRAHCVPTTKSKTKKKPT